MLIYVSGVVCSDRTEDKRVEAGVLRNLGLTFTGFWWGLLAECIRASAKQLVMVTESYGRLQRNDRFRVC